MLFDPFVSNYTLCIHCIAAGLPMFSEINLAPRFGTLTADTDVRQDTRIRFLIPPHYYADTAEQRRSPETLGEWAPLA